MRLMYALLFYIILRSLVLGADPQHLLEITLYNSSNTSVTILNESMGPVWDGDFNLNNTADLGSGSIDVPANYISGYYYGFHYVYSDWSSGWQGEQLHWIDTLGYSFYKITALVNGTESQHFYLDMRDANLYIRPCGGGIVDWSLKWYGTATKMKWKTGTTNWTQINSGDTLRIWEVFQDQDWTCTSPNRTTFEPNTPQNLAVTADANGHPKISWTLSEPASAATYEVYRRVCTGFKYLDCGGWHWIDNVSAGNNECIDDEFQVGGDTDDRATYKVYAMSGDGNKTSSPTFPFRSITGEFVPYSVGQDHETKSLTLPGKLHLTAYPNPFNPRTQLAFSLDKQAKVRLTIFDVTGRPVYKIAPHHLDPGQYQYQWDARQNARHALSSGMYFVQMQIQYTEATGGKTLRHKLLLLQ